MKKFTALTLVVSLLLTACGDCNTSVSEAVVVAPVTTAVDTTAPSTEPESVTSPDVVTTSPIESPTDVSVCPQGYNSCPVSPHPVVIRPRVVDPSPVPSCTRDYSTDLVYIEPFWVDNCGNKYGTTSSV